MICGSGLAIRKKKTYPSIGYVGLIDQVDSMGFYYPGPHAGAVEMTYQEGHERSVIKISDHSSVRAWRQLEKMMGEEMVEAN